MKILLFLNKKLLFLYILYGDMEPGVKTPLKCVETLKRKVLINQYKMSTCQSRISFLRVFRTNNFSCSFYHSYSKAQISTKTQPNPHQSSSSFNFNSTKVSLPNPSKQFGQQSRILTNSFFILFFKVQRC